MRDLHRVMELIQLQDKPLQKPTNLNTAFPLRPTRPAKAYRRRRYAGEGFQQWPALHPTDLLVNRITGSKRKDVPSLDGSTLLAESLTLHALTQHLTFVIHNIITKTIRVLVLLPRDPDIFHVPLLLQPIIQVRCLLDEISIRDFVTSSISPAVA